MGSDLPPESSDQTPSFMVSSEKLLRCPLTDRPLSLESFPFVPADMELFPWGQIEVAMSFCDLLGHKGLSYSCCPMSGSSWYCHLCWNDAKLCCGYMCAIKPETQRRHHTMHVSQRSWFWVLASVSHLPWTPLFLIRRADIQLFISFVYPKP